LRAQASLDVVNLAEQVRVEGRARARIEIAPQGPGFGIIFGQKLVVRRKGEADAGGAVHEGFPYFAALRKTLEGQEPVFKVNSANFARRYRSFLG
jgi:hypothetical protein